MRNHDPNKRIPSDFRRSRILFRKPASDFSGSWSSASRLRGADRRNYRNRKCAGEPAACSRIPDRGCLRARKRRPLLPSVECTADFLLHVAGTRPAHQRLDVARLLRLVVEHPFFGVGLAGLHRRAGRSVNTCGHEANCSDESPDKAQRSRMVGAAGFEPATFCSQSRRATRLRYAPPVAPLDTLFGARTATARALALRPRRLGAEADGPCEAAR